MNFDYKKSNSFKAAFKMVHLFTGNFSRGAQDFQKSLAIVVGDRADFIPNRYEGIISRLSFTIYGAKSNQKFFIKKPEIINQMRIYF